MADVHVAITRKVKPGKEAEFEAALRDFARNSMHYAGTTGVYLVAPVPGEAGCEYGIMRTFVSEAASEAFYHSPLYADWQRQIEPLVIGEPGVRRLHGLEAFFRNDHLPPPPKWKMALVTWIGVFPTVLFWSKIITPQQTMLPPLANTAVFTLFVVATLAWAAMPLLTRLFAPWLHPVTNQVTERNTTHGT